MKSVNRVRFALIVLVLSVACSALAEPLSTEGTCGNLGACGQAIGEGNHLSPGPLLAAREGLFGLAHIDGLIHLVEVGPETGKVESLVNTGLVSVIQGAGAFDPAAGRFFFLSEQNRIASVALDGEITDVQTTELLGVLSFDPTEGRLLALAFIGGLIQLAEVDSRTGEVAPLVNTKLDVGETVQGVEAFDSAAGRFFFLSEQNRIASVGLDGEITDVQATELLGALSFDPIENRLLALAFFGGTIDLAEVDTETGAVTPLVATGLNADGIIQGVEAFDPVGRSFFFLRAGHVVGVGLDGELTIAPVSESLSLLEFKSTSPCAASPAGLVAWWSLEETSGTLVRDVTGNHNAVSVPGSINSNGPTSRLGYVQNALQFDPSSVPGNTVEIPHDNALSFGTSDFTVEVWARGIGRIASKYDQGATGGGFEFFTDILGSQRDGVAFRLWSNSNLLEQVTSDRRSGLFQGWHHWAVTVERGTSISLYLDGRLLAAGPISDTVTDISNLAPVLVGSSSASRNSIDEIALYSRALSAGEIHDIYVAGSTGKCKDDIYNPWDTPFCPGEANVIANIEACNYSSRNRIYELELRQVLAGDCPVNMPIDGPMTFRPDPFTFVVIANRCRTVPVTITRPVNMDMHGEAACYQSELTNLITGESVSATGSVVDTRNICTMVVDPGGGSGSGAMRVLAPGGLSPVDFTLANTSGQNLTFDYLIEAMSSDMNPGSTALVLNDLPAGEPVSGSMSIPIGGESNVSVDVAYENSDLLRFQQVIFSARLPGEEYVPLISQGFRNPLPGDICSDPDFNSPIHSGTVSQDGGSLAAGYLREAGDVNQTPPWDTNERAGEFICVQTAAKGEKCFEIIANYLVAVDNVTGCGGERCPETGIFNEYVVEEDLAAAGVQPVDEFTIYAPLCVTFVTRD